MSWFKHTRIETTDGPAKSLCWRDDDLVDWVRGGEPGAKRLMSAGWVWHPWDAVVWFDVAATLADPTLLDKLDDAAQTPLAEQSSAAWLNHDQILIGGSSEAEDPEEAAELEREHPGPRLRPNGLAVYDITSGAYARSVELGYPPGTMMPVGSEHVVTFFRRPRLVSLATGKIVHEWTDIDSGEAVSSIVGSLPCPPLALDPARVRFAVAGKQGIDVITIDVAALAIA